MSRLFICDNRVSPAAWLARNATYNSRRRTLVRKGVQLAGILALCVTLCGAQSPQQQQQPEPRLTVSADLVSIDVTVADSRGRFLADLKRENFRVLDDGVEQSVSHFTSVEKPAQVLLLVETGPAMTLIRIQHLTASRVIANGLAAHDEIALVSYSGAPQLVTGFTREKPVITQALRSLNYASGDGALRMFDSLAVVLDWLSVLPGRKAVVLLSTGLDVTGVSRHDRLLHKLRAANVTIYTVALGGILREPNDKSLAAADPGAWLSFEQADKSLQELAAVSGGRAFVPRKPQDFENAYRQISTALRHQYTLGFAPPVQDGSYRKITVQVVDDRGRPRNLRVTARQGYVAPGGTP